MCMLRNFIVFFKSIHSRESIKLHPFQRHPFMLYSLFAIIYSTSQFHLIRLVDQMSDQNKLVNTFIDKQMGNTKNNAYSLYVWHIRWFNSIPISRKFRRELFDEIKSVYMKYAHNECIALREKKSKRRRLNELWVRYSVRLNTSEFGSTPLNSRSSAIFFLIPYLNRRPLHT